MKTKEPLSYRGKYLLLAVMPVYFMIAGLFCQPVDEIFSGLIAILREPDFLITDYFVVGGVGAAFFNAGTITLILLVFLYCIRMEFDGHTITSCCLLFGFSLFGKNLLNIWAILFGVFLYARCHRVSIRNHLYVGLYGTSLSPIITQVMQIGHLPLAGRLVLSVVVGICIGFVLPPLSAHVRDIHKGYSLYNVGFSAGIIATVVISLFKSFGITVESRLIWDESHNTLFGILLSVFFVGMIVFALAREKTCVLKKYWQILKCSGIGGTDYWKDYGDYAVLFNMGVNGLFATGFVLAVGGDLNGPTIGGDFYYRWIFLYRKASEKYCTDHDRGVPGKSDKALVHQRTGASACLAVFYDPGAHCRGIWRFCRPCGGFPAFLRCVECGDCVQWDESVQ